MDLPGLWVPNKEFARHVLEEVVLTIDFFEVDQLLNRNSSTDFIFLLDRFDDKFGSS